MDWSGALSRIVVPKGGSNSLRFQGERGHYEAWYLTFNARPEKLGFWLRYTLDSPLSAPGGCELWAHVFDAAAPEKSFGLRERFPLWKLSRPEGGLVGIGEALLSEGRARGAIRQDGHSVEWNLSFDPDPCAVHLAPLPLRALRLAKTQVVFANPDARFFGTVKVDGREIPIAREPGGQTHLWGRKHVDRWAWCHCNAFDGRDDCSLDGVAAFVGPRALLPLTGIYVRYRGLDYCLNALPRMLRARSEVRFPVWHFRADALGLTFEGTLTAAPRAMVQVGYEDPDGERSWCANSEIANAVLEVRRGTRLMDRLVATGTAHLEFGSRQPWPDVRATV